MARSFSSSTARLLFNSLNKPSSLRHGTVCIGSRYFSTQPSTQRQKAPSFAFAFDIDGVLLRSSEPIPGASESLTYLKKNAIPFMLLTNGGGRTEKQRTTNINERLALKDPYKVIETQLVQSHTPIAELAVAHGNPSYKDKTVLVLGGDGDSCRTVARSYGFTNVVIPADIFHARPDIWPFSKVFTSYYHDIKAPLPASTNFGDPDPSNPPLKIDAVFVFNDPRDWGLDIQLTLDILLSQQGVLGTYSPKNGDSSLPNHGYQSDGQPPIYFTNPDLIWANAYPLSRLGQGGFREALNGVWKALTKSACGVEVPLKYTILGKPHRATYEYAEKKLLKQREEAFGRQDVAGRLEKVYMIGDNPESDIMGANNYKSLVGADWVSVLTKTGVYREREGRKPSIEPRIIVGDVLEGVRWALRDSGWDGDIN